MVGGAVPSNCIADGIDSLTCGISKLRMGKTTAWRPSATLLDREANDTVVVKKFQRSTHALLSCETLPKRIRSKFGGGWGPPTRNEAAETLRPLCGPSDPRLCITTRLGTTCQGTETGTREPSSGARRKAKRGSERHDAELDLGCEHRHRHERRRQ